MNAVGENTEFAGIPRSSMLKVLGYDIFSIGQILVEDGSYEIIDDDSPDVKKLLDFIREIDS